MPVNQNSIEMKKSKHPLVSIVIPSYNHEKYIEECILSVINQDYKNIEIILIDDGSIDATFDIAKKTIEKHKKVFINYVYFTRENRGLCATLNEAILIAHGKYIAIQASDDISDTARLCNAVENAEKYGSAAVCGQLSFFSENKNRIIKLNKFNGFHDFESTMMLRNLPAAPTALIRKDVLFELGLFNEKILIEDFYIWLKILSHNYKIYTDNRIYTKYRKHESNLSSKYKIIQNARLEVLSEYQAHPSYLQAVRNSYFVAAKEASRYSLYDTLNYLNKAKPNISNTPDVIKILLFATMPTPILKLLRALRNL